MTEEARLRLVEEQLRLEADSIQRGVDRYREAVRKADIPDTEPGVQLMKTILTGLITAIQAAQAEALELLKVSGRTPQWVWPMLMMDAERLAVITARAVLTYHSQKGEGSSRSVTSVAIAISQHTRQQREFDLWKEAQNRAESVAREEGREYVNVFKLMLNRVSKADARTVRKWLKKGEAFDREEWPTEVKVHFGWKLIDLLVQHGGGCFEVVLVPVSGRGGRKTERRIKLTELALHYINDKHAACELTRPWLLPMVCPPNEWKEAA